MARSLVDVLLCLTSAWSFVVLDLSHVEAGFGTSDTFRKAKTRSLIVDGAAISMVVYLSDKTVFHFMLRGAT